MAKGLSNALTLIKKYLILQWFIETPQSRYAIRRLVHSLLLNGQSEAWRQVRRNYAVLGPGRDGLFRWLEDWSCRMVCYMAMGFACAGVAASFYKLVTSRPISFELADAARYHLLLGFVVLMFAGPAVIMRNAVRGRMIERRAIQWLILSTVIAVLWSFLAGITLIHGLNALEG